MVTALRVSVLTISLMVSAGLSHSEESQVPVTETADYSSCMSGDAAACDRTGQAFYQRAAMLKNSGVSTSQVQEDFASSLDLAKEAWIKACGLDFASSCTKLGNYYQVTKQGTMKSVRAFHMGCTLGDDTACTIIQNFKDKRQNEQVRCLFEYEQFIGAVPWTFRGFGTHTEMYAPGFTLRTQLTVEFGQRHGLVHTAPVQDDEISRFVFEPKWLNTLVRNGDLKIDYIGKNMQSNWGFRITGNESGTQALLAQFGSGQGILYSIDFSESPYGSRVPEHQSGEIKTQGYPQALEYVRAIRQQIQSEAEQGLCNPDL